jgi:N-carbamoyl-L-amino-acid hydrolase
MTSPAIDARRVIADLRELARRTGDERGAQRLCWTEGWTTAREFLAALLDEVGLAPAVDDAGNAWAELAGDGPTPLALGSHLDSVPDGGWLDGALGVMAAMGVVRAWAESGQRPPRSLVLVDWADEEGARFGASLFGSSAFAGTLDDSIEGLHDAEGRGAPEVLAEHGVEIRRALELGAARRELAGYLELHIEQGPVLEDEGIRAAAVSGCVGIERHHLIFTGQASHAGTTPMDRRRDAGLAAAATALQIEAIGRDAGGMATTGALELRPGIPTAVAGEATLTVDLRHAEAPALTEMLAAALEAGGHAATQRGCELGSERIWGIAPTAFDPQLVDAAAAAVEATTGSERRMTSGALHDAAEVARVAPAAMVFVPSIAGISHAKEEDTSEADLAKGIEAFGTLANRVLGG